MKHMWDENTLKNLIKDVIKEGNSFDTGSTKKIYWHTLKFQKGGSEQTSTYSRVYGLMIVLTNTPDAITLDNFKKIIAIDGFKGVIINGKASNNGESDLTSMDPATYMENASENSVKVYIRNSSTNVESYFTTSIASGWVLFEDLGANPIN